MGRREQRERIFKLLFRVEFHSVQDLPEQVKLFFEEEESEAAEKDSSYITEKYTKIQGRLPEIDRLIDEKTEGWDANRIGKVELTILRLAAYEILFDEQIPSSVAINEAVEIAKKYGQETSGGFVNAVLAKFV